MKAKALLAALAIALGVGITACTPTTTSENPAAPTTDNPDFIELEAENANDSAATEHATPTDSLMVDSASAPEE